MCNNYVYKTKKNQLENQELESSQVSSPRSVENDTTFANLFWINPEPRYQSDNESEAHIFKKEKDLENEITLFASLIGDSKVINSSKTTKKFWEKYQKRFAKSI